MFTSFQKSFSSTPYSSKMGVCMYPSIRVLSKSHRQATTCLRRIELSAS